MWKIIVMGIIYFCFSLWDSVANTFYPKTEITMWRIIPASALDSFIYFWILQSLLDTIQELEDKKQTGKLDVFLSLRNMIIVAVIVSTLYNVGFSYLIIEKKIEVPVVLQRGCVVCFLFCGDCGDYGGYEERC